MTEPTKQMTLTRTVKGSPALVWAAWTQPQHFSAWFGYPLKTKPGSTLLDVQPGGEWQSTMIAADGRELPFAGHYVEVVPNERLVMTFKDVANPANPQVETLTVTFKAVEGGTELTLHQAGFLPDEQYPKLIDGYNHFLDGLNELFIA